VKVGTMLRNICLMKGDHDMDCNIPGTRDHGEDRGMMKQNTPSLRAPAKQSRWIAASAFGLLAMTHRAFVGSRLVAGTPLHLPRELPRVGDASAGWHCDCIPTG
jgi:hypothetical protein